MTKVNNINIAKETDTRGYKAIFTANATDGQEVKITVEHEDANTPYLASPIWCAVEATKAYVSIPTALLSEASKAEYIKTFGKELYGSEEALVEAYKGMAAALTNTQDFYQWCSLNDVDHMAVAQNIVYDGAYMYDLVMKQGVENAYGDLISYYGFRIFD